FSTTRSAGRSSLARPSRLPALFGPVRRWCVPASRSSSSSPPSSSSPTATPRRSSGTSRRSPEPSTDEAVSGRCAGGARVPEDGHVVSGVFTFGVGVKAPPPTEAYGASGPTTTEHVVRWAYFLSLALLLGGLGFRLLLGGEELPAAAERRFFLVAGAGVVATLE